MAEANGSGDTTPPKDDDPDRTQRIPSIQKVVDEWFSDDPPDTTQAPMQVLNRTARRMREQHEQGRPTTGRRGCLFSTLAPAVAAGLLTWAVR